MVEYVLPVLYALFLWWFSTGAILYLDGLRQDSFKWSMLGATVLLAGAFFLLQRTANDTSIWGAYAAFTAGLVMWGWQQISFYMGYVTGPRKTMCTPGCSGWRHFGHALQTSLYHEASILISGGLCMWLTWGTPNQIGLWTFLILWWMHESARLNVFFGVRNVNEDFLPEHMAFLKSFLKQRPMNLLFPVSVTVSTVLTMWTVQQAIAALTPFQAAGYSFLAALLALAVLEHWFLVLPLPSEQLWQWALKKQPQSEQTLATVPLKPLRKPPRGIVMRRDDTMTGLKPEHKNIERVGVWSA